jgi:hypothetical protein
MTQTIRLMSDWGLHPFYVDSGDGFFALIEPDDFQERFCLPGHVVQALLAWDELYQDVLDRDDPGSSEWASADTEQQYVERGRDAARLLRRHVPADVVIEYLADESVQEYY